MSRRLRLAVRRLPLPPVQRAVLASFADFAPDDGGPVFRPVADLVAELAYSRSTVRRAIDALEAAGHLVLVTPAGARRSPRFRVVVMTPQRGHGEPSRGVVVTPDIDVQEDVITDDSGHALAPVGALAGVPLASGAPRDPEEDARSLEELMATKGQPKPFAREAQALAGSWWEARDPRPIGSFLAARERVREALEAGWSEELCARALAKFSYVPTRAAYVEQLDRVLKIERARAGEPPVEEWTYEPEPQGPPPGHEGERGWYDATGRWVNLDADDTQPW